MWKKIYELEINGTTADRAIQELLERILEKEIKTKELVQFLKDQIQLIEEASIHPPN